MKKIILYCIALLPIITLSQEITTGIFGGDAIASGNAHNGPTVNKWVKFGEFTLNGNYSNFICNIDFYPINSNHGDSRQQINIGFRNNTSGIEPNHSVNLITFYGLQKSINDVKVVHTSGSGVSNNTFSIWIQMGVSWLSGVPFEFRYKKSLSASYSVFTTNQPYHTSIQENGTIYDINSRYGMFGSNFKVDGKIYSEEVNVELNVTAPDYVFEPDYNLRTLKETEAYIKKNKHLPEIPSAVEIEANGLELGEMNMLLLKKIEELTLHIIEQNKQNDKQQKLIEKQQKRLEKLEKNLN